MRHHYLASAAIAALMFPAAVYAQETSSSVRGMVSSAGVPVAGATVTVVHEPSGTTATSTTDVTGGFNASGLRVGGPVTVTVSASGYQDSSITDIFLSAGTPFRLPIEIEQASEIIVTASKTKAVEVSTGPITTLNRESIEGVASVARDIRDLARRDAFVTIDLSNSRTIEIAGQNGRLNRFSVDGVQFSDDFGLNNGGLPTSRGPVPLDAIEQFAVKVAPYDISEGDFQGGAVNVVLRSGGNNFTGSAFYTYTNDNLTGGRTNAAITPTNPRGSVNLDFDSKNYGGFVSGPIIKDKLFFAFAYEKLNEQDPFDDGVGPGFANQVPNLTVAQLADITSTARSVYNYDTLGISPNAIESDEKFVGKLDVNITDDQRASLTFIRNVGTQQFQQGTNIAVNSPGFGLLSNYYELEEEVNSGVFQLNSKWADNFSTEFRASYRDYNRSQTPFGSVAAGQYVVCLDPTSVNSGNANSLTSCGATPQVTFGPDISRHSNALNTDNLSIDLTAKLEAGAHTVKYLFGYTRTNTFNLFLQRSRGDTYFDSVADFQNRRANRFRLQNAVPSLNPDNAAAAFATDNFTVGIQDDWDVTDNLQITYAARYDFFKNDVRPPANLNFLGRVGFLNTENFSGKGAFQPRLGITWKASDRLILRGGAGIFAGGTPDVFLANSFSNTGQLTNAIDIQRNTSAAGCNVTGANATAICNAALNNVNGATFSTDVTNFLATNTASLAAAPVNAIAPGLKLAQQLRATFSANYEADLGPLGDGWLLGADFLYGKTIFGYTFTDLRSVVVGRLPDGRTRYGPFANLATTNQDLVLTNSTQGRSLIGVVRIAKSWDFGLSIDGSYTRSDITDESANTSATAGSLYNSNAFSDPNFSALGTSIYQIKDQFKFGIDFNRAFFGDYKTRLSLFGEYRTGRPFSYTFRDASTVRSSVFGTVANNANQNASSRHLLYVPLATDPLVSFDSAATETAFNNFVTANDLERFRGRITPKNIGKSQDIFKVDLHVEQELPAFITSKARFKIFADIENVLNLINPKWGSFKQVQFPYNQTVIDVQCLSVPVATGTAPGAGVVNTNSTQTCAQYRYSAPTAVTEQVFARQSLYAIRVGVKFEF